jgi:hypothetical protein
VDQQTNANVSVQSASALQQIGASAHKSSALHSKLGLMRRRPFGIGEDGKPVAEDNGKITVSAIRLMQERVASRAVQG